MISWPLILFFVMVQCQEEEFNKKGPAAFVKKQFRNSGKIMENARSYMELLRNSDKFIDKSHFIAAWHFEGPVKVTEMRCAPRWGKTITLHMVKKYFEIELYENWTRIPLEETTNYRLFQRSEILHENGEMDSLTDVLNVNAQGGSVSTLLGSYPVILVSFENITASNYDDFVDQIAVVISDVFKQHMYLEAIVDDVMDVEVFYSQTTGSDEEAYYKEEAAYKDETDYQNDADDKKQADMNKPEVKFAKPISETASNKFRKILDCQASAIELTSGIHLLSKLLHEYFKQKVYILMDDYDCIFKVIFLNNIPEEDELNMRIFYKSLLLNSLQYNDYLEKSLIAGTYDAKTLLKGFETTTFNTSINILYNPCGFTRFDIDRMFRLFPIDVEANRKARQWYNGYRCGRKMSINMHEIEPFVSIFNANDFTVYHTPNLMDDFIRRSIQVKRFRGLLANSITGKGYMKNVLQGDTSDILKLKDMPFTSSTSIDEKTRGLYLTLLVSSGYFTARMNGSDQIVQIPNHRIKYQLSEMLMDFYKVKYNISQKMIDYTINETYKFIQSNSSECVSFSKSLYRFFQKFSLYEDIFPLHLMRYIFHYFALKISTLYNYRLLEMLVVLGDPMEYFSLYNPERRIIFGIKLSNILTERMVKMLQTFENSTTKAPVSNYTKIVAISIPRYGDFIIHHEEFKNY
ncbi:uncharacterized protein LOC135836761 [Planococcus citri]|uniref:uncharacterized protein LOC135836761 n=1 Tax=Planococcus citri TaxID=170843 RepID=UPI0031F8BD22